MGTVFACRYDVKKVPNTCLWVNHIDNSHGIISALAELLPASQWDNKSITNYAKKYAEVSPDKVIGLKYDMDAVNVFALLRPMNQEVYTLDDLRTGFSKIAEMTESRWDRMPCASVSFLGGKSNKLVDKDGNEPSFEKVLTTMHDVGYRGDVILLCSNVGTRSNWCFCYISVSR